MSNSLSSVGSSFYYPASLDRSLSLRSTALNLAGGAASAESGSLQGIIRKNIESTFSTFNYSA